MIDLTPLEVRKKKGDFRRALRGYEPELVDDFLDIVADRLEQLVRENATMTERITRLEQQVSEYRDRERALTDALVTAQAMREEITQRTTREAEEVRRSAQERAESQLRDAEQQAGTRVRDAEQRAQEQLRRSQEEAEERLQQAEAAAAAKLDEAEREAYRLRSEAVRAREQEEDALRRLRAKQQQLVKSYRTFLERELAELDGVAQTLGATDEELEGGDEETGSPAAPSAEPVRAVAAAEPSRGRDSTAAPVIAAAAAAVVEAAEPEEMAVAEAAEPAAAPAAEGPLEEEEPFEPEPVYEEDLDPPPVARIEPVRLLGGEAPEVAVESGEAAEEAWPELDMLPEGAEPDFTRPELSPRKFELPWTPPAEGAPEQAETETEEDEPPAEDDAETDALLENAARAGYRLDLDEEPELLLEETVEDSEPDNWLDSIIEEDR